MLFFTQVLKILILYCDLLTGEFERRCHHYFPEFASHCAIISEDISGS